MIAEVMTMKEAMAKYNRLDEPGVFVTDPPDDNIVLVGSEWGCFLDAVEHPGKRIVLDGDESGSYAIYNESQQLLQHFVVIDNRVTVLQQTAKELAKSIVDSRPRSATTNNP